jgi:hypothetical protein
MTDETIVAVYDTVTHAESAIKELIAFGISESSISQHGGQSMVAADTAVRRRAGG